MTSVTTVEKKNGGYSLIELLVIIAIISVFTGFIGYNIAVTNSFRARECAKDISTDIQNLKVTTLAKSASVGDTKMILYKTGKEIHRKFVYKDGTEDDKLLVKRVTVRHGINGGLMKELGDIGSGDEMTVIFNRASGSMVTATGAISTTTLVEVYTSADKKYTVELVPSTGKVKQK